MVKRKRGGTKWYIKLDFGREGGQEQSDPLCINHCRLSFKPFGFIKFLNIMKNI